VGFSFRFGQGPNGNFQPRKTEHKTLFEVDHQLVAKVPITAQNNNAFDRLTCKVKIEFTCSVPQSKRGNPCAAAFSVWKQKGSLCGENYVKQPQVIGSCHKIGIIFAFRVPEVFLLHWISKA